MLGDGREDVHGEPICVGHIGGYELDAGIDQLRNERDVAAQSIKLRDHELGAVFFAGGERGCKLRPIAPLAALDLNELGFKQPLPAIEKGEHGCPLRVEPKSGLTD